MYVQEIPHLNIYPSCYGVYESSWVMIGSHNAVYSSSGVGHSAFGILTPAFVPYNPCSDTGMMTCSFYERFILAVEILHIIFQGSNQSAAAARRHVLPDNQSVLVAPVEPQVVLQLDMFPDHIHAKVLHYLQVIYHSFVRGRCQQSVGPPALIQRAVHIEGLVVQQYGRMSVHHSTREFTHSEVSAYLIAPIPLSFYSNIQIVKVGLIGAP